MQEIYEKMYDVLKENMQENELTIGYSKEAFLYGAQKKPGCFNVPDIIGEEDKEKFLELAYLGCFDRLPEASAKENWKVRGGEKQTEAYQRDVLNHLIGSRELRIKRTRVLNNMYKKDKSKKLSKKEAAQVAKESLLIRIYRKLPEPIKNVYRRFKRRSM